MRCARVRVLHGRGSSSGHAEPPVTGEPAEPLRKWRGWAGWRHERSCASTIDAHPGRPRRYGARAPSSMHLRPDRSVSLGHGCTQTTQSTYARPACALCDTTGISLPDRFSPRRALLPMIPRLCPQTRRRADYCGGTHPSPPSNAHSSWDCSRQAYASMPACIPGDTRSPRTCWRTAPISARSNCCSGTVVCKPR